MHPSDVKKKEISKRKKDAPSCVTTYIYFFSFEWSVVVERYFMKMSTLYIQIITFFSVNYQNMLYVHRTHGKGCIDVHVRIYKICNKILNKILVKPTRSENALISIFALEFNLEHTNYFVSQIQMPMLLEQIK